MNLKIYNNSLQKSIPLESKNYVKYLGVLIDSNLSWRYHMDHISSKISKGVGIIARLRHFVPTNTLIRIYRPLIEPYISHGLTAWGQAANCYLIKVLILHKRALRLIYFSECRAHAIPLFLSSSILPLHLLFFKYIAILMHDVANHCAPSKITDLFIRSDFIHSYYTRFSAVDNFYVQGSRTNQQLLSFSRNGTRIWNKISPKLRKLSKALFKQKSHKLLLKVLEIEEVYVDVRAITSSRFSSLLI